MPPSNLEITDKMKSSNKGVQRTRHKVSGPLTPDVGLMKMKVTRRIISAACALFAFWVLAVFMYLIIAQPPGCTGSRQQCVFDDAAYAVFMLRANAFLPWTVLALPMAILCILFLANRSWHQHLWLDRLLPLAALILQAAVWSLIFWRSEFLPTM